MASSRLLSKSGALSIVSITPAIEITPDYATGDLIGGKLDLADASRFAKGGGLIQSVVITDLAKQSVTKDIIFFSGDPSATTFTENGALDVDDADLVKIVGFATLDTWVSLNDNSVGGVFNLALPFALAAGSSLFCAMVERGAGNYGTTADLTVRVGILDV